MARFTAWRKRLSLTSSQHWACDFGSTVTKIIQNDTLVWQQASCLARHRTTKTTLAIGNKAYQLLGKNTATVEVIFPISNGVIADTESFVQYAQAVFEELGSVPSVFASLWGTAGVCTTLSGLSPAELQSWKTALQAIGIGTLRVVPQARAAATALSFGATTTAACCVVDLGGQVSEVAIVTAGEVVQSERLAAGGVSVTERIQEIVRQNHQTALSWHTAELLKRELASVGGGALKKKMSVRGKDVLSNLGTTIVVSASELLEPSQEFAEQVIQTVGQVVSNIPTELAASCLEQGLYVVGGTSQMEGLATYLREHLKTEVHIPAEPSSIVVRGAAAS